MPLVMRAEQGVFGPVAECDTCGERVRTKGVYGWVVARDGTCDGRIYFAHKGGCHDRAKDASAEDAIWCWWPVKDFGENVVYNLGFRRDWEALNAQRELAEQAEQRGEPVPLAERVRRVIEADVRRFVLRRDLECRRCGADGPLTIDHIVPVARGGTNDITNLQALCRSCNSRKGASLEESSS